MEQAEAVKCDRCTYWQKVDDVNGYCRRHAPHATANMDEVAHWPMTRGNESCGEGAEGAAKAHLRCDACVYWRQVGEGIDPMTRRDQLSGWWRHAAYCVRYAPTPSRDPAPRGYWQATNAGDGCFDGKPRNG
jgi:hypothetical protein